MSNHTPTIESIKQKAAKELGFVGFEQFKQLRIAAGDDGGFIDRCIELALCVRCKKSKVIKNEERPDTNSTHPMGLFY